MKYKIWNKQDNLINPVGGILTPEQVIEEYPMAGLPNFKFIICDAPINMGVFMEFEQTKMQYKQMGVDIQDEMTDQEVLDAITYHEENPPEQEPTAEERMAAAMEFQNLMSLQEELK